MSNVSKVGPTFKGVAKGKLKYSGSNTVDSDKNVDVGGSFDGIQEEKSEIEFAEKNELKNSNKQDNVDKTPESTEPSTSNVEKFKLENDEDGHIGDKVYVGSKDQPSKYQGIGAVINAKRVGGTITNTFNCRGNFNGPQRDIGSVTVTKGVDGDVKFDSDVNVSMRISKELGFRIDGHMTIFNQEFRNSINYRLGSNNDVEDLYDTFRRLGIEPKVKPDLKYKEIVNEIEALSKTDFSACKLFLCVYMSHGHRNGYVSAADKEFNLRKTIIDPIMGNESLYGIPKIFITVACRGDDNYEENDNEEFDGRITSTGTGIDYSNCIISYSTYEGHVSKRTRKGTYFIQSLCENINKDSGDTKIHSIFAKVNGKLADMYKQVPVFETSMGDISFKDLAPTAR